LSLPKFLWTSPRIDEHDYLTRESENGKQQLDNQQSSTSQPIIQSFLGHPKKKPKKNQKKQNQLARAKRHFPRQTELF
jgi:hypothetical protein